MLIVIEGLDGCGKSTQLELLKKTYTNAHFITFPYYNTHSGRIISDYLADRYRESDPGVSAYSASAMYAVDRYTSYKTHWEALYQSGAPLFSARYTSSNAIYQMTKLTREDWDGYLAWLFDFEYKKLGLPEPDLTIFLDMPIAISQRLLTERYGGEEEKKDLHERNVPFLNACREAALYVGERFGWETIRCDRDGEPRRAEEIGEEILKILRKRKIETNA
ncbi:MAG: deoxynucleoside kinase [Bacteroides sp.]|nr:deoxynucleoside kinase [Eubacterium sp.]MCM1417248.1 deoxynucleoside kinase [Roseburia sp.]MCM1461132.1 deoxynucleoside kinase [Bacteroides sp.]